MAGVTPADSRSRLAPWAPPLVVAAIAIASFAANCRWLNDNGFFSRPPANDSSWYRLESYRLSRTLQDDGLASWLTAANRVHGAHPPFIVMFAGLCLGACGRPDAEPREIFFVSAFFGVLMTIGTYRLARNFLPPWGAALSAFIATACPGTLVWWRPLDCQLPMSAFVVLSLDAIVRSRGFTRFGHSALAGIWFALGLQSKMLAPMYVAGPIVVALIAGCVGADRPRAWRGALIAGLCALPGALFWYPSHYRDVIDYTKNVIGDSGQIVYSSGAEASAWARWLYYPRTAINEGFGFWVGILVVPALIVLLVQGVLCFRARASPARFDWRVGIVASSPLFAYVPLTLGQTSSGSLYLIPFVPLGATALLCAIALIESRPARRALQVVAGCAAVAVSWTALRPLHADRPGPAFAGLVINDRTDSRIGDPARSVGAFARPEGERWPAAEFVREVFRQNRGPVRYGFAELTDQPLMTAAVIAYEAARAGIPLRLVNVLPFTMPRTPLDWARCRQADYFVLSSRQASLAIPGGTVADLVRAIRGTGVEVEVIARRDPTPLADLSLVKVIWPRTNTATAVGREALADPRLLARPARFTGGTLLHGVRGKVLGDGSLVVTTIWEPGRIAGQEPVVGIAVDLPGDDGREWRRPLAVGGYDTDRPLIAVTSSDLRLPKDAAPRVVVRVYPDIDAARSAALIPQEGGDPSKDGVVIELPR